MRYVSQHNIVEMGIRRDDQMDFCSKEEFSSAPPRPPVPIGINVRDFHHANILLPEDIVEREHTKKETHHSLDTKNLLQKSSAREQGANREMQDEDIVFTRKVARLRKDRLSCEATMQDQSKAEILKKGRVKQEAAVAMDRKHRHRSPVKRDTVKKPSPVSSPKTTKLKFSSQVRASGEMRHRLKERDLPVEQYVENIVKQAKEKLMLSALKSSYAEHMEHLASMSRGKTKTAKHTEAEFAAEGKQKGRPITAVARAEVAAHSKSRRAVSAQTESIDAKDIHSIDDDEKARSLISTTTSRVDADRGKFSSPPQCYSWVGKRASERDRDYSNLLLGFDASSELAIVSHVDQITELILEDMLVETVVSLEEHEAEEEDEAALSAVLDAMDALETRQEQLRRELASSMRDEEFGLLKKSISRYSKDHTPPVSLEPQDGMACEQASKIVSTSVQASVRQYKHAFDKYTDLLNSTDVAEDCTLRKHTIIDMVSAMIEEDLLRAVAKEVNDTCEEFVTRVCEAELEVGANWKSFAEC